jgi:hypothetical protein
MPFAMLGLNTDNGSVRGPDAAASPILSLQHVALA